MAHKKKESMHMKKEHEVEGGRKANKHHKHHEAESKGMKEAEAKHTHRAEKFQKRMGKASHAESLRAEKVKIARGRMG